MQGGRHRPADDAATECIECDRQIEEASPRWNVRDIGHPQHVRALGCEVTLDQIGRLPAAIAYGRDDEPGHPSDVQAPTCRRRCFRPVTEPFDTGYLSVAISSCGTQPKV